MSDGIPPADFETPDDSPENDIVTGDREISNLDIRDEMQQSYLTYAMSVIVSRALPDVRDGLKPAQRRILVAMNDLSLGPSSARIKCAKIAGDTSGNYHPHGEQVIYPTLVRMAQDWVMREILVDKQGNFGSIAGLGPAAMRYTEARLSSAAAEMLDDLHRGTVDFIPSYDHRNEEPVVLPSRFPNLLVNGSQGIAVGMATSIPPHNLGEVAQAVQAIIDNPDISVEEIMQVLPGPDFPTGGVICGRYGILQGYRTGRSTITLRAKVEFETEKNTEVIVVKEIPYLDTRDRIKQKLEELIKEDRIEGISRVVDYTDRKTPNWQVRLHIYLKRDADREIVLNQLYKYSPLQTTVSVIMLALVGNRPQTLNIRQMCEEFIRHREEVIRRKTEFLLAESRKRKHTVEGMLIAQLDIDQIIQTIRQSPSRAEAKIRLQKIDMPAELVARALGDSGWELFQQEYGVAQDYSLSANQCEAIVSMQLGSLANLERENLLGEHAQLIENISDHLYLLADPAHIRAEIRKEMEVLQAKYTQPRRTEISEEELHNVDRADLITEETMVVTLSQRGYIKRTPLSMYQAQNRGGKGIKGTKGDEEDPVEHLFVSSTHAWLLFFTNFGKVYWQKVYDLPLQGRTGKGRALVNLLNLGDGEQVQDCIDVREFSDDLYLLMATRQGIVKKTVLSAYSRPMKGGIIAIKLDDDDRLIDVVKVAPGQDVVLSTAKGMTIRFTESDARPMGRNTMGVKGIKLGKDDVVVGMIVAEEEMTLLTVCENGFGKRTPFGVGELDAAEDSDDSTQDSDSSNESETDSTTESSSDSADSDEGGTSTNSSARYRRQKRGGKGVRDIKTTDRNGQVIGVLSVLDGDDILLMSASGKIQRLRASDINVIGRNTQGVRVMRLDKEDKLVSLARIPSEFTDEVVTEVAEGVTTDQNPAPLGAPQTTLQTTPQTGTPESSEATDDQNLSDQLTGDLTSPDEGAEEPPAAE